MTDGVCYASGDAHSDDGCKLCDPETATDIWSDSEACVVACDPACAEGQECVDGACQASWWHVIRRALRVKSALTAHAKTSVACDPACAEVKSALTAHAKTSWWHVIRRALRVKSALTAHAKTSWWHVIRAVALRVKSALTAHARHRGRV